MQTHQSPTDHRALVVKATVERRPFLFSENLLCLKEKKKRKRKNILLGRLSLIFSVIKNILF